MSSRVHITPIGNEGLYILDTGRWRTYRPVINKDICSNCGICLSFCPVNAMIRCDKQIVVTLDYCKGCGICSHECPQHAVGMVREGEAT